MSFSSYFLEFNATYDESQEISHLQILGCETICREKPASFQYQSSDTVIEPLQHYPRLHTVAVAQAIHG